MPVDVAGWVGADWIWLRRDCILESSRRRAATSRRRESEAAESEADAWSSRAIFSRAAIRFWSGAGLKRGTDPDGAESVPDGTGVGDDSGTDVESGTDGGCETESAIPVTAAWKTGRDDGSCQ